MVSKSLIHENSKILPIFLIQTYAVKIKGKLFPWKMNLRSCRMVEKKLQLIKDDQKYPKLLCILFNSIPVPANYSNTNYRTNNPTLS
jgi:hypothetical protein